MIIMIITLSRMLEVKIRPMRCGCHCRYTIATNTRQSIAPTPAASDGVAMPP